MASNVTRILPKLHELNTNGILLIKETIYNSSNMLITIQRLLPELSKEDTIKVLEKDLPNDLRSLKAGIWKKRLKCSGHGKPWYLSERVVLHGTEHGDGVPVMYLEARNTYQSVVLGIFATKNELKLFKTQYYAKGILEIVFASNQLTREYYVH